MCPILLRMLYGVGAEILGMEQAGGVLARHPKDHLPGSCVRYVPARSFVDQGTGDRVTTLSFAAWLLKQQGRLSRQ